MSYPKNKKILVSRNLKSGSALRDWAVKNDHALIEVPFIRIDPITNQDIPPSDWIFFSSPNGVDVYFDNYPILARKIAVFGSGTLQRLTVRGLNADFIGDNSKMPHEIGRDFFDSVHPNEVVFFPLSKLSRKSILSAEHENKCIELAIYDTSVEATEVPKMDVAILTSPSNIQGYLEHNRVEGVEFIVMGATSQRFFESLNTGASIHVPDEANEQSVVDLLEKMFGQM
ncbi:MAG: uroporphyrinogen-III synthase [Crocinitomicaceae bacterium]|nr:uroporphyrinogen-III synthase [Crocinitomicaceae bacterium]